MNKPSQRGDVDAGFITEQALSEFEQIWRKENPNTEISQQELLESAIRTLRAVELVYRAIPKERADLFNQL